MPISQGTYFPIAPSSASLTSGSTYSQLLDHTNATVVSELHGKYYNASKAGNTFSASVTGVTIPANAATLVSVFSLWNPIGSGKNLEIISADIGFVLGTAVIGGIGLYFQGPLGTAPTLTTAGTPINGLLGSGTTPAGKFYSALTHAGTPTLAALIGSFNATTTLVGGRFGRDFDGQIILPPASVISVAATTAAFTGSAATIMMSWCEWPV